MLVKTNKALRNRLRISFAEANRVRSLLLSPEVETLSKRDIQTLLVILNDVYPVRRSASTVIWQPFVLGSGIGLLLVIGVALLL